MHQAKNLTWKQERFVSEYLLSGNAAEAVRRAGYQTRYPSEKLRSQKTPQGYSSTD